MPKKKKTQLKPIPRGFATTSVLKKVAPATHETTSETEGSLPDCTIPVEHLQTLPAPVAAGVVQQPDSAQIEQQALQALVDKLQDKTEKEIIRSIKIIETDRRLSKSLPTAELNPVAAKSVIEYTLANSQATIATSSEDYFEEQALQKAGITYGILRRRGFTEARVLNCLRSIKGAELEEAYEWLYLHCSLDELETDEPRSDTRLTTKPTVVQTPPVHSPQTPRTPSQFLVTPSSPSIATPLTPSRLDANAPEFRPSSLLGLGDGETRTMDRQSDETNSGRSSPDTLDPTGRYVQLKLQYDAIRYGKGAHKRKTAETLLAKLSGLKSDYLFSQKEANALYQVERQKANAFALKNMLDGEDEKASATMAPKFSETGQDSQPSPSASTVLHKPTNIEHEESDSDDNEGGMFAILEALPTTETTQEGTTITVRDMALPKSWSGRTPKALLKDVVTKQDRYATVAYELISGRSRAKRASVTVRWETQLDDWRMDDTACHDEGQAEQYIATIALHTLTYPKKEGFAANPPASTSQTFFRTLPPAFRDLWDELEVKRKLRDDEVNRRVWGTLRSLIRDKYLNNEKFPIQKEGANVRNTRQSVKQVSTLRTSDISAQMASLYDSRRTSAAYRDMLAHRNQLPIAAHREDILATLEEAQVLVLSGETGCGKSTQVPSFILEDRLSHGKPCKIYCTEPRRISAISLAQRVSQELGEPPNTLGTASSLVGYSIRLESNTSRNTCLTFVTNGIALRMLEGGSGADADGTAFDEITHIIIDEVHERTIESDFLLIVLKSLLQQRPDLRVILMSATLDADKISNYFDGCPTFHVPGRTFPVDVNYLEDAIELTGWSVSESSPFARRRNDKFYQGKARDWSEDAIAGEDDEDGAIQEDIRLEKRYSAETTATINLLDERLIPFDLIVHLLEVISFDHRYVAHSPAILIFMPGIGEIRRLNDLLSEHPAFSDEGNFRIYPLHSTLSSESQTAVFEIPPQGVRKIVIATNIAETGITIPDVTCVIDTGKHREMRFDEKRQISRLVETFIARSNAAQRRGRAGRVRQGICFHLFTKNRHDIKLANSPLPEMMRLSLADLALRIKIMRVNFGSSIENVLSQALDPPAPINVQRAITMLVEVRALTSTEEITPMGRLLSKLPTDVHLGKFLLIATIFRCLDPALTIAATLNSKSPFLTPFGQEQEADRAKQAFRVENSDFLTLHNVFSSWRQASANSNFVRKFCRMNFLSHQNLQQIEDLRQQFLGYLIDCNFIQVSNSFIRELNRARYVRNRSRFVRVPQELDSNATNACLVNAALVAGLFPKILSVDNFNRQIRTLSNNQITFIHPSSVNFGRKISDFGVNYLSYFTLMHSKKLYAWEIGPVDDMALILLCGDCEFNLSSCSVIIDRKIKYKLGPKSIVALKALRNHLGGLLSAHFRGKRLGPSEAWWNETAMKVLGRKEWEPKEQPSILLS